MKKLLKTIFAAFVLLPLLNFQTNAADDLNKLLDSLTAGPPARANGSGVTASLKREAANPLSAGVMLNEVFSGGKSVEYKCALIDALGASGDEDVARTLVLAMKDRDEGVRVCAARSLGEQKNEFAVDLLVGNVENYLAMWTRGPYENNIKVRLAAINSIWSLGEIGAPAVMGKLQNFYLESDDVIKINILISIGKLKNNAGAAPYLRAIAASTAESEAVRASAFEMLDELKENFRPASVEHSRSVGIGKGDLIYSGGIVGTVSGWFMPDLPIGHAGVFAGTVLENGRIKVLITDCVPNNFKPGGVRNIDSWKNFTHQFIYPYYGNRTTNPSPTAEQREKIVARGLYLGKQGLKYTNTHIPQKGPEVFDCVGYTEYLYEYAGLNPTPDKLETDWGWPLTPSEQFDSTVANTHVPLIIVPPQAIYVPSPDEIAAAIGAAPLEFTLTLPETLPLK